MMKSTERRRDQRITESPPLRVSGLAAAVHDVSRNGICLIPEGPLIPGDRYFLTLEDALDASRQGMEAEVIWYSAGRAGLRWVQLPPDQDLWLLQRFESWLAAGEAPACH